MQPNWRHGATFLHNLLIPHTKLYLSPPRQHSAETSCCHTNKSPPQPQTPLTSCNWDKVWKSHTASSDDEFRHRFGFAEPFTVEIKLEIVQKCKLARSEGSSGSRENGDRWFISFFALSLLPSMSSTLDSNVGRLFYLSQLSTQLSIPSNTAAHTPPPSALPLIRARARAPKWDEENWKCRKEFKLKLLLPHQKLLFTTHNLFYQRRSRSTSAIFANRFDLLQQEGNVC